MAVAEDTAVTVVVEAVAESEPVEAVKDPDPSQESGGETSWWNVCKSIKEDDLTSSPKLSDQNFFKMFT